MLLSKPLNLFLFFHCAPFKASEPISFFSSSHQALSSLKLIIPPISLISPHLSSSSHLHSTPKPKPSPSPAIAPGVARHSHLSASPLPAHPRPCRHRPIFPSNPSSNLAVTDPRHSRSSSLQPTPQPTPVAVASPLQVSALFSFLVNFFNCCFGLIFLGLVLILC